MWLINTTDLFLKEFLGQDIPRYAILSHRWGNTNEEQTFKDFQKGRGSDRPGHQKIVRFCELAASENYDWAWVDTCCIDKRSSAELTESINSMFTWYQRSQKCYVYMSDIGSGQKTWEDSSWWTRGWTLQELIAPHHVVFYDQAWNLIDSKRALAVRIEELTNIPAVVLWETGAYMNWTVAQKMSWASTRSTKRIEDRAYSLLGLFHINMPLLYGEGEKAFQRLQLEILQKYSDESLFAWQSYADTPTDIHDRPLFILGRSPDDFARCADMSPSFLIDTSSGEEDSAAEPPKRLADELRLSSPPRATSWGIKLRANAMKILPIKRKSRNDRHRFYFAVTLTTAWSGRIRQLPCTLVLAQHGASALSYKRIECHHLGPHQILDELRKRYKLPQPLETEDRLMYLLYDRDFNH